MKTLQQLVFEEMTSSKRMSHAAEGIMQGVPPTPEQQQKVAEVQKRIDDRLAIDRALNNLATVMAKTAINIALNLPISPEAKEKGIKMMFTEMISIWEDANIRFDAQLKPAPQHETQA